MINVKENNKSMSGLVFQKIPLGACPKGFNNLLYILNIRQEEEFFSDGVGYRLFFEGDFIDILTDRKKDNRTS